VRKILVVAVREYVAAVKTKSFVIGIILMPVLMSGGFVAQALLSGHVDFEPKRFVIIDHTPGQQVFPVLEKAAEQHNRQHAEGQTGQQRQAPFFLQQTAPPPDSELPELRLKLSERVKRGDLTGFLEIGAQISEPSPGAAAITSNPEVPPAAPESHALRYQTNRTSYQAFSQWAQATINADVLAKRADKKGLEVADINAIVKPVSLLSKGLTTRDPRTGQIRDAQDQNPIVAFLLPGGLVLLMFIVVQSAAGPMLQGVMEEKLQRIAEVLLGSMRPFQLMMGKLIGMACVSLTMASVYLAAAYWGAQRFGYAEYLAPEIIFWFLVFQVLAVFMYGSIYAGVGAACTDMKEAQTMLAPLALVTMLPFFIWVNVVQEPTSTFSTVASLFPLLTPMLMTARLAIPPGLPIWQPLLGVVIVMAATVFCVYVAGRIFRVGILLQGKGPRFADLVRWAVRG
jgi:ABC-2 type transport system permease protein